MCANMFQIVLLHAMSYDMLGCAGCHIMPTCVKEFQGNKRNKQAKMQLNEHIRELISRDFIFFKRGMLGILIIFSNTCQVKMCAKC